MFRVSPWRKAAVRSWLCSEYSIASNRIYTHRQVEEIYHLKGTTRCPGRLSLTEIKRAVDRAGR